MGIVDIKIDIMREWRSKRCGRSVNSNPQQQQSCNGHGQSSSSEGEVNADQYIDHELYWAAAKATPEDFMSVVDRLCEESGHVMSQHDILMSVSPQRNSLLHVAAEHGNFEVLRVISDADSLCSLTYRNCNGDTPLHLAAQAGHEGTVTELLIINGDCERAGDDQITREQNAQGNTALHMALINSNKTVAECLFRVDPDAIFCLNKEDKSGLYLAAEAGYEDLITDTRVEGTLRILVEKEPWLVQSRDDEGRTPLHHAALTGCLDGVKYLLSKHSRAAVIRDNFEFFPIHLAVMEGRVDVLEILLKHSIDPAELLDGKRRNVLCIWRQ